jgi:single-strand DNA-binding protein
MADQNNFVCTGRLGNDPELKYTQAGKAMCTLSVAIGGYNNDTLWMRAKCWEKTAEIANQYLKKGSRVALSGRLSENEWQGQDGTTHRRTELNVRDLTLLDPKAEGQGQNNQPRRASQQPQKNRSQQNLGWGSADNLDDVDVDEIPF